MHIVEITRGNELKLAPGRRYLAEDINAGEMLSRGWCKVYQPDARCTDLPVYFVDEADRATAKLLFVRPGGFGDLLFLTPTFRELKKRWPECEITVACHPHYHEILLHNPDVDAFITYPVNLDEWRKYSAQVWLENIVEENPDALTQHAVDLIWERVAGDELGELSDKTMRYVVTRDEFERANEKFGKIDDTPRIGLQVGFNQGNLVRTYPNMGELADRLWREGYEVVLFGKPGDARTKQPDRVINLTLSLKSIRDQLAVISTCDCVVAPDSVLCHVAGALNLPCVALYGPFPWQLRTAYAEKTFALQGTCPVSPCFHHARPGKGVFPENGPCSRTHQCEALDSISVDRIIREVEKKVTAARPKRKRVAAA